MILDDKTVMVIGAGPGLGGACAAAALRDGANVVVVARNRERLHAAAAELDVDAALVESATAAVEELEAACAVDAICRGYLDGESFTTTMERVIADLDADPIVVPVEGGDLGIDRDVDVVLDGRRVAEFTLLLLYSESRMRYLPAVIVGLALRV